MDKIEVIFQNAFTLITLMHDQEEYFEKFKKNFAPTFDTNILEAVNDCIECSKIEKDKLNKAYRNALTTIDKLHKSILECHSDFAPKYENLKKLFNEE